MNVKKFMLNKKFLVLVGFVALFAACKDDNEKDSGENIIEVPDTIKNTVVNVNGELFSVPSPIQTALLIQKSGVTYDKSILHAANKVNTYSTDYLRALNLGIYGADLGYVSLYNQTQDAIGYLGALKQLADKLGVSAAFDAATMKRIEGNITNKDSMLVLVGIAYRSSDAFLKNNQRHDVSSLILTGGWIESMHFSVSAYKAKGTNDLKWRIAEQKQALGSLIKILSSYQGEEVQALTTQLNDLSKIYEGITFKYNFVEPTHDSLKKVTYINSTTEVMVSEEQITQIAAKIAEIRTKIVNSNS
jgi:hypothetical protein